MSLKSGLRRERAFAASKAADELDAFVLGANVRRQIAFLKVEAGAELVRALQHQSRLLIAVHLHVVLDVGLGTERLAAVVARARR